MKSKLGASARFSIKLFLTIWLIYALYVTPAGGVTPNRYVDLVHSIVNEGRFAIDTYNALPLIWLWRSSAVAMVGEA
jgi:hypothetical protein